MHYLRIYQLQDEGYGEVDSSPTFPLVPKDWLYEFLAIAKRNERIAVKELRSRFQSDSGSINPASDN